MQKSNNHKKIYREDKFARHFFCQHARLNYLRNDKQIGKKKTRLANKRLERNYSED